MKPMNKWMTSNPSSRARQAGLLLTCALLACAAVPSWAQDAGVAEKAVVRKNSALVPAPPRSPQYLERHQRFNERVKQGPVDLVFIGDSITHFWEKDGKAVWDKYYARRNAVDLGIAGDRTQHVLWRIAHGNLDGISPKLAVLMIGTNNSRDNTPEQTAEGIAAIVGAIQAKTPSTKILLLGIFPRGKDAADPLRQKNQQVNQLISKLDDGKSVFYLDIGSKFLEVDGTLSKQIMPDYLHPKAKGYAIWAEAIEPKVKELMGEQ